MAHSIILKKYSFNWELHNQNMSTIMFIWILLTLPLVQLSGTQSTILYKTYVFGPMKSRVIFTVNIVVLSGDWYIWKNIWTEITSFLWHAEKKRIVKRDHVNGRLKVSYWPKSSAIVVTVQQSSAWTMSGWPSSSMFSKQKCHYTVNIPRIELYIETKNDVVAFL